MAKSTTLSVIQPIPYFPLVAPLADSFRGASREYQGLQIEHAPMFYFPRFLKSLDGSWLYRSVLDTLRQIQRTKGLDLVDAHFGYPEGVGALLAARRLGVPCFVTLRGFEAEYINKPFIGRQIEFLLRNADGCICVSHSLKKIALERGANPERLAVIHNAIDRELFYLGDRYEARRKLDVESAGPIVLSVGHLIARKRHHVLLDAFRLVANTFPDAMLLIVGAPSFEKDYPPMLQARIQKLGLENSVRLLGNVPAAEIGDYLRAANVFALASAREGCCNAVLEALACGLPVVTTPVGDNPEFVRDGDNGYIVPVDDSHGLADAILMALRNRHASAAEIAGSLQVGSWEGVARRVLSFFDIMVDGAHRKGVMGLKSVKNHMDTNL